MDLATRILELLDRLLRMFVDYSKRFPEPYFDKIAIEVRTVRRALELATREAEPIFARLTGADIECPRCHRTMTFKPNRLRTRDSMWDKRRRLLVCRCGGGYTPAVILYPRSVDPRTQGIGVIPQDHVPSPEQRAHLLAHYAVSERLHSRPKRTNLVMPRGCTCEPGQFRQGSNPACLVHGKQR